MLTFGLSFASGISLAVGLALASFLTKKTNLHVHAIALVTVKDEKGAVYKAGDNEVEECSWVPEELKSV